MITKGEKFGKLTAIKFVEMRGDYQQYWLFKCDCGVEKIICASSAKRGHSTSCGCFGQKNLFAKGQNTGEDNTNWQGGISNDPYPEDWTEALKRSIRQRDNYICQECGIHQDELAGRFKKLDVHHIDYNKNNLNPDNLIALCRSCHMRTNANREYWTEYFNN